jgi:hypothetical protein
MRIEEDIWPEIRAGVSVKRFEIATLPIESLSSLCIQMQKPLTSSSGIFDLE